MGFSTLILGVSYNIIPTSCIMKGDIRLFIMDVTCKAFQMTNM